VPRRANKVGRKPQGLGKHGEPKRIRDYPTLLVTVRPSVKATLERLAAREDRPKWKIVEAAIRLYERQKHVRSVPE